MNKMNKEKIVSGLLAWGIAFTLTYASIAGFMNPGAWVGFIPDFISKIVGAELFLKINGVVEIVLALWLISGKKVFYPAVISGLMMLGILIFNFGAMDILFRDVAIVFMASALAVIEFGNK